MTSKRSSVKILKTLKTKTDDRQDIQEMRQMRDSFERFGDDLSQVVVSYLPFEDRFRCQCVSKHIQRTVFTTQTDLDLSRYSFYKLFKQMDSINSFTNIVTK